MFLPIMKWNEAGHLSSLQEPVVNGIMNPAVMSNGIMLWQRQVGQISLRYDTISFKFTSMGNIWYNNIIFIIISHLCSMTERTHGAMESIR